MEENKDLLLERGKNPFIQAVITIAASLIISLIGMSVGGIGITEVTGMFAWLSAASFLLLFAVFNSVISLVAKDTSKYWGQSMSSFMIIAVVNAIVASLLSGIGIFDAGSATWIYTVIALGYLIFLGIVVTMKNIVAFAQREEWSQPRRRHRRKK